MLGLMPISSIVLWKNKKLTLCSIIWWYCMLVYVLIVIMITVFSREQGSRKGIDLQLFAICYRKYFYVYTIWRVKRH